MTEPIIYKVDEDIYNSGRLTSSLQFYKGRTNGLQFFDARCNWTANKDTERYYHIIAEDEYQAESLAKQAYAKEFHISQDFVEVRSSYL